MKYWNKQTDSFSQAPEGSNSAIYMKSSDEFFNNRVLSIHKLDNGRISFIEECDGFFAETMEKKQALDALQEAIDWIKLTVVG